MIKKIVYVSGMLSFIGCMHSPEVKENQKTVVKTPVSTNQTIEERIQFIDKEQLKKIANAESAQTSKPSKRKVIKSTDLTKESSHYRDDIFHVSAYGAPHVKKWENYFMGRGRRHMDRYLDRLPRYEALMKRILREEGVPEQLIYIALIESGFNSTAHSSARAVGYWQFIRGTGKAYGLKQNWLVDERRDPIKSTRAAAQYFKALYRAFGSWHLAMSSYNAGEHRVLRAIMGNVTRDFWSLHEKKQLPRETLDYVPKFIAAAKIASSPAKYGFSHIEGQEPFAFESIRINKGINLKTFAKKIGTTSKEIKRLNPIFKTSFAPIYKGSTTEIRVPVGKGGAKALAAAKTSVSTKKFIASEGNSYHRVKRGDSLYRIARRYKTSVSTLKSLNGLSGRSVIRPGMKVKLPGYRTAKSSSKPARYIKESTYKVRKGDSLWSIARKYGMSVSRLKSLNNLRSSSVRSGKVLKLKPTKSRATASANSYKVRSGDNLTKIARKFQVPLTKLMRHNGLSSRSTLRVGKRISIPR